MVEDPGAARLGQELCAEPDEPPSGHDDVHADPARAVIDQRFRAPLAEREELRQHAEVLLGRVDRDTLDGLVHLAVDLPRHDLRLADRQFEALTSHLLDENRELELAPALNFPGVG